MSIDSNKTLLLLSMVNGSFKVMEGHRLLNDQNTFKSACARKICERIIHHYPATGDEQKNAKWMKQRLIRFDG